MRFAIGSSASFPALARMRKLVAWVGGPVGDWRPLSPPRSRPQPQISAEMTRQTQVVTKSAAPLSFSFLGFRSASGVQRDRRASPGPDSGSDLSDAMHSLAQCSPQGLEELAGGSRRTFYA